MTSWENNGSVICSGVTGGGRRLKSSVLECGVVLLCSQFQSPENNLFQVGYHPSPIPNRAF